MALIKTHLILFDMLRKKGIIGHGRTNYMMELGEQNWFGDVAFSSLKSFIETHHGDSDEAKLLNDEFNKLVGRKKDTKFMFDVAKLYYRIMFEVKEYVAIDLHGTENALPLDLNVPLSIEQQFHVVTNLGTSEHVFNQYQFFRSAHELTAPSGLMIHSIPNQGGWDHGFYNYHPTFLFDLAAANGYHIVTLNITGLEQSPIYSITREEYIRLALDGKLPIASSLIAVFQKPDVESDFKVPMQGFYDDQLPEDLVKAWKKFR